jgi:hypothetical protein
MIWSNSRKGADHFLASLSDEISRSRNEFDAVALLAKSYKIEVNSLIRCLAEIV